jgi:hypothetical protein
MNLLTVINEVFVRMQSAGNALQGLFLSDGLDLLAALGLIMATWHSFIWLLAGDLPDYLVNLLRLGVRVMVMLALLLGWSTSVHSYFVGNMQTMADRVSGGNAGPGQLIVAIQDAVEQIIQGDRQQAAQTCEQVPNTTPEGQVLPGTHQECQDPAQPSTGASGALNNLWGFFSSLPIALVTFLMKGLAIIAMVLMGLIFMVVSQMATVLLAIAFCLGPVLVPWYVFPVGEFLFDGWLRSTISFGLYKVIAWIMMTIVYQGALPSITQLSAQIQSTNTGGAVASFNGNYIPMLALTFVCGMGAYMMWQVPGISGRFVSGGGGGSLNGFGKGVIGRTITPKFLK